MATIITKIIGGAVSVVAAATVTASIVWAGATVLSQDSGAPTAEVPSDAIAEIDARLDEIDARLDSLDASLAAVTATADEAKAIAERAELAVGGPPADVETVRAAVEALSAEVAATAALVQRRTASIDDTGRYTGPVSPDQLGGRLTAASIRGDWPLDRVSGILGPRHIFRSSFSCSSDSRSHGVVSVDGAGQFVCLKIPK